MKFQLTAFKALFVVIPLLFSQLVHAKLTQRDLSQVESAVQKAFLEIRPTADDILFFNSVLDGLPEDFWWNVDMVHASYVRKFAPDTTNRLHHIFLMGGFVRLPSMTMDGLALTACHEIGHGVGGEPTKNPLIPGDPRPSTEGQADYYATRYCLSRVLDHLEPPEVQTSHPRAFKLCSEQTIHTPERCLRMFTALESDIAYFEFLNQIASFDEEADEVAAQINLDPSYYPSAQCRIDTMINGILHLERPKCWYPSR